MKGKRFLTIITTMVMLISVSACGNSEAVNTQSEDTRGKVSETTATDQASDIQDTAEIIVMYPSMGPIPNGLQAVEDAMNEITEEEINTHVTLKMVEVGNYDQQVSLMLSSNEQLDLMITMPGGSSSMETMLNQNQLLDITELLEQYAPRALAEVGELIKGTQRKGKVMAFPAYKGFVGGEYINMRTDVLEDLGLMDKALSMTSFSEFEEIMEAVKNSEKWNYLACISSSDGHGTVLSDFITVSYSEKFSDCKYLENIGTGVSVLDDGKNTVVNTFDTDAMRQNYQIVKSWYDKGYVYKDSPTTSEMGQSLVKSNVTFSYISTAEVGGESGADDTCGMDMTSIQIMVKPISTTAITKFTWAVPTTSKEPKAAITFLEMMFNDPRIANLFSWGIEDVDYEVGADGRAHYIEGNENPAYHTVTFLNANKFMTHPWENDDPNINVIQKQYMDDADYSPYLGFNGDYEAVTDEISAVSTVYSEFQPQIVSGVASAEVYEDFLAKLSASGIDKIITHYQEQLNTWIEENR